MKAVSQIVILVLILMIAVSLTVSLYFFTTETVFDVYPNETAQLDYLRSRACLDLEVNSTNYLLITNCGLVPLSKFQLYVDYLPINADFPDKLDPKQTLIFPVGLLVDEHTYVITSDLAESPPKTIGENLFKTIKLERSGEDCVNPLFCELDEDCCPGFTCNQGPVNPIWKECT